jgi:signal transduction histidine kinase
MSLRSRLTLTYSGLVALLLIVFSAVLYTTTQQALEWEMDQRLQVRASQVQLTIWPGTRSLTSEDLTSARLNLAPLAALNAPNVYVQVVGKLGQVIAKSESLDDESLPIDSAALASALAGTRVLSDVLHEPDHAIRILSVPINVEGNIVGVLQVGQSRRPLQETMANLRTQLQVLGAAALALAALLGWFVAHHGLRPLGAMSRQAETITARRDFSQRLDSGRRDDEVDQLAVTINQLLATVEETLQSHREFLADTSHELRNPLLAIRTNLELISRIPDENSREECLHEAREQVDRMSRLVSDLLLLARVEAAQVIEQKPVAVRPLLDSVAGEARRRSQGQEVRMLAGDATTVLGDEGRLAEVFTNLVDNALKHTPPGGSVVLHSEYQDGWVRVRVRDDGEGIAGEDLPHVFERFYRGSRRGPQDGGAGLGLAIAKHLTEAHGGHVTVRSEPGQGAEFTVLLPAYQNASSTDA